MCAYTGQISYRHCDTVYNYITAVKCVQTILLQAEYKRRKWTYGRKRRNTSEATIHRRR